MIEALANRGEKLHVQQPKFSEFNPSIKLSTDYFAGFQSFVSSHSVSEEKQARFFLTSQSPVNYKIICNLASQMPTPKDVNQLTLSEIENFIMDQFHPKRFLVNYKCWTGNSLQKGETIQELAERTRQDAVTCDFPSASNHLNEALRFMCCIRNEVVFKALFKAEKMPLREGHHTSH